MFKISLFPLLFVTIFILLIPGITKGDIDISSIDLSENIIELSGTWKWYPHQLIDPLNHKESNSRDVVIPQQWNSYKVNNKDFGPHGYSSYKTTIFLNRKYDKLNLIFPDIGTAYRVYIDSKEVLTHGKVGKSVEDSQSATNKRIVKFSPGHRKFTLIIHVSNFTYRLGGIYLSPLLSTSLKMKKLERYYNFLYAFLLGAFVIIAIVYIIIFFFQRNEYSYITFSIAVLVIGSRMLIMGDKLLIFLFPDIGYRGIIIFTYLTFYIGSFAFILYIFKLFEDSFSKVVFRFIGILTIIISLLTVLTPVSFFTSTPILVTFELFIMLTALYILYIVLKKAIEGDVEGKILLGGIVVLVITAILSILRDMKIIYIESSIHWGIFIFIISQSMLLSKRFVGVLKKSKVLNENLMLKTDELKDLNETLEDRVIRRTSDLEVAREEIESAMEEVEAMNISLRGSNMELEFAKSEMQKDLDMAEVVQQRFLFPSIPEIRGWDVATYYKPLFGVSGDFYDFYISDVIMSDLQGIGLFDVSGHGTASGLITMTARSIIYRNFSEYIDNSLSEIMEAVNEELNNELISVSNYLTGMILRFKDDIVEYVNCAHTDLIIKSSSETKSIGNDDEDFKGSLMGAGLNYEVYEKSFNIKENEYLIMYSDGFIESKNKEGEFYDLKCLIASIDNAPLDSSETLLDHIIKDYEDFIGEIKAKDDLSLVILKKISSA